MLRRLTVTASPALGNLVAIDAVRAELSRREITLTLASDIEAECDAVLLCEPSDDPDPETSALARQAEARGLPVIGLGPGWIPNRLRLTERSSAMDPDTRPKRLLQTRGRVLDDEALSAVCAALPAAAEFGTGKTPVVLDPDRPEIWSSLAAGREVILRRDSPDLPLLHSMDGRDAQDVTQHATEAPLNQRDATRRLLASEAIFNSFASDPQTVADALAEAIRHVAQGEAAKVSVLITCYNYANYVGAAIKSVLAQTHAAYEIIVVDDGSTDGSADVIDQFEGVDLIRQPNLGQASAFNAAFARSSGNRLLFLDADDVLAPGALARIAAEDIDGLSRLSFGLETISSSGAKLGLYPETRDAAEGWLAGPLLGKGMFPFMPTSGNVFPRRTLERLLPMPEANWRICADLYLILASALYGPSRHLKEVLGGYRVHGDNAYYRRPDPTANEARFNQRRRAWEDLLRPRGPCPRAWAHQLRTNIAGDRLSDPASRVTTRLAAAAKLLQTRLKPPSGNQRRPVRATRLTSVDRSRPLTLRALHLAAEGDPILFGGPATWPVLETNAAIDLTQQRAETGVLGQGWGLPKSDGALMKKREATMGFLLPAPVAEWRVGLGFQVEGEPVEIEIWLNGTLISRRKLRGTGTMSFTVPASLLDFDRRLQGYPLAVLFVASRAEALRMNSMKVRRSDGGESSVPWLPPGQTIELDSRFGMNFAGQGWPWPGANDQHTQTERRLYFSVAGSGDHTLWLASEGELPAITLNGELVSAPQTHDSAGLTVSLPKARLRRDGAVSLGLLPLGDGPTRVSAMRLDPVCSEDVLLPGEAKPASAVLSAAGTQGFKGDGIITTPSFRLPLHMPASEGQLRLVLRFAVCRPLDAPPRLRLRVDEIEPTNVVLGADTRVPLTTEAGPNRWIVLEGFSEAPSSTVALVSVEIEPVRNRPAVAGLDKGATGLMSGATDPRDWHLVDGALWLASQSATLNLPPSPNGSRSLCIQALTLPDPPQSLVLTLGDSRAVLTTGGPGLIQLALPPVGPTALHLRIESSLLVAPAALGSEGDGVLGGAITEISFSDDRAEEAIS